MLQITEISFFDAWNQASCYYFFLLDLEGGALFDFKLAMMDGSVLLSIMEPFVMFLGQHVIPIV